MSNGPGYWMYETSGKLRPAFIAYFGGGELIAEHIAVLRAYARQWILAGVWDRNPHMDEAARVWLAEMRADIDTLTTRAAFANWFGRAIDAGMDPL